MEPPDRGLPVRPLNQTAALAGVTPPTEEISGKVPYAITVTTALTIATVNLPPWESIIARNTTHNGMPAVTFKVKIMME